MGCKQSSVIEKPQASPPLASLQPEVLIIESPTKEKGDLKNDAQVLTLSVPSVPSSTATFSPSPHREPKPEDDQIVSSAAAETNLLPTGTPVKKRPKNAPVPRRKSLGPLSPMEIKKRIEAPKSIRSAMHAGREIKFAWVSQRGYYPEGMKFLYVFIIIINIDRFSTSRLTIKTYDF
jgi:hypothetical protein